MSNLARNWQLVRHTEGALRHGAENLGNVPALLRALLLEKAWREFSIPNGDPVTYRRFSEFVAAAPPRGLGADLQTLERVVADDKEVRQMLRDAERIGKPGPPADGEMRGDSSRISDDQTGKTDARLARDHPEMFERVKAKELSTNAAAVMAGIRPRRISVRLDRPDSIARSLRKHLTPEQVAELRALLDDP